ncbi:uncharacterized protein LOC120306935 isoform X2 [Crotalus tigris]|uniref:uncharacterized protein LOC120306935 isoform X2 n=1 Tax=Crotalus tigris TaxID=88082 RepID=UPI00192F8648|nr:uncharacterized protein LOC120306935 isoform X2 [Crotalus tigris]
MAEGTQGEDPVVDEGPAEADEQMESPNAEAGGEEQPVVRQKERGRIPAGAAPGIRQRRLAAADDEWWFGSTAGLPEDGKGRRLAPSFTGWRERRMTGDEGEDWSCSTAPGQYTLDVLREQFGERIYPNTIRSPIKDSPTYMSHFQMSSPEFKLQPDSRFTPRDPVARQTGAERPRYGLSTRGVREHPEGPERDVEGPLGVGPRPVARPEAVPYGGQGPAPWPQNMVWNPPPIALTFDGDPDRLAVFLSHVLNHLDRYTTLYSSNWARVVAVTASLQGEAAAWAADLYSDQARELADVGLFLDALKTRFEDPTRLQRAEAQLVNLRQRGRPVQEYIREFQKVAGKLRSWPDSLLIHHFRNGLDTNIRQACIIRGVVGRLADWFRAAVELDIGLRDRPGGREDRPRRNQDQPVGGPTQTMQGTVRPKPIFKCFRCNRPGHRAAECGIPEPIGTPTAIGKPGATPKRTVEKSRVAYQLGQTSIQQPLDDASPGLQEHEEEGPVEDPMGALW